MHPFKNIITRYILTACALSAANNACAQATDSTAKQLEDIRYGMAEAGKDLSKYSRRTYTGMGLQLGGLMIMGIGSASYDGNSSNAIVTPFVAIGAIVTAVGFWVSVDAHRYVGRAGNILQHNGLAIPIPSKKASKNPVSP